MLDLATWRTAPAAVHLVRGRVRVLRAAVLGGMSLALAAGAHVLGGGALPSVGVMGVSAVLLGLVAAVLTARRCRLGLLLGLLAVQQLALHELFDLAAAARSCDVADAGMVHLGSTAHLTTTCTSGGMPMATGTGGGLMVLAHVVATAVTAWLLARGETWLWRVVDRVAVAAGLGATVHTASRRAELSGDEAGLTAYASASWCPAGPRGPPVVAR